MLRVGLCVETIATAGEPRDLCEELLGHVSPGREGNERRLRQGPQEMGPGDGGMDSGDRGQAGPRSLTAQLGGGGAGRRMVRTCRPGSVWTWHCCLGCQCAQEAEAWRGWGPLRRLSGAGQGWGHPVLPFSPHPAPPVSPPPHPAVRLRKHPVTCDRPHYLRSCKSEPTDPEAALRGPQALWPRFTLCQDCSQAQLRLLTAEPTFQGQELKPRGGPVTQLLRAAWARCLRGWGDKPSVCQGLSWF